MVSSGCIWLISEKSEPKKTMETKEEKRCVWKKPIDFCDRKNVSARKWSKGNSFWNSECRRFTIGKTEFLYQKSLWLVNLMCKYIILHARTIACICVYTVHTHTHIHRHMHAFVSCQIIGNQVNLNPKTRTANQPKLMTLTLIWLIRKCKILFVSWI